MKLSINSVLSHPLALPLAAAAVAFEAGAAIGWYMAKRDKTVYYGGTIEEIEEVSNQPQLEFPDHEEPGIIAFDRPRTGPVVITPEQAEANRLDPGPVAHPSREGSLKEIKETEEGLEVTMVLDADQFTEEITLTKEQVNVFTDHPEEWDYVKEEASRGNKRPFIIHLDEYHSGESKMAQKALTFYEGDEIMVDEDDVEVTDYRDLVGDNLNWGHGSRSADIVFIRNPHLEIEYEITRSYSSYAREILGIEAEHDAEEDHLRHMREPRKFRFPRE